MRALSAPLRRTPRVLGLPCVIIARRGASSSSSGKVAPPVATSPVSTRRNSTTTSHTPSAVTADFQAALPPQITKRNGTRGPLSNQRGFIDYKRNVDAYRNPDQRALDWGEINTDPDTHNATARKEQAARCMDCGTPFCHTNTGCPISNLIPEWNQLVYQGRWREAYGKLALTNNFPEFTGRVCPAPCEGACVAGLVDESVTIKNIEYAIVDKGFKEGWLQASPPPSRTAMRVSVVGSGPAGLACADQLNKMGHTVSVYEREDRVGGLLTYGIPNMKLDKKTVERRVQLLADEGINFVTNADVGGPDPQFSLHSLRSKCDATVICGGATKPRDLRIPGRNLVGIHFAMDYLTSTQKRLFDISERVAPTADASNVTVVEWDAALGLETFKRVSVKDKHVVVIGGGDTGCDCIASSVRMQCKSLTNLELQTMPPATRSPSNPWPEWPRTFKVEYGHAEAEAKFGSDPRMFGVMTKEFVGTGGGLTGVKVVDVNQGKEVPGSERILPADVAILALGFTAPEAQLYEGLGLAVDKAENIEAAYGDYRTLDRSNGLHMEDVFAAGDCRRGQSLVVWAIHEGRQVAERVHAFLSTAA